MTVWRTRVECWIPKATNTHSEYVILIPFPTATILHENTLMLLHAYIASLVGIQIDYTTVSLTGS